MIEYKIKVWKTLSRNDTGETRSHQSGISIPKEIAQSAIFPQLGIETMNPRIEVLFYDEDDIAYKFQYIYYNDVFFRIDKKRGHNEFRITCVKDFIRNNCIKAGDKIWLGIDANGVRRIGFDKIRQKENNSCEVNVSEEVTLILKGGWKYIKY